MTTRIRLRRVGRKKQSTFRIVVAGQIHARDGRSSETIGKYNPRTQPTFIEIDEERALFWLRQGAEASEKVRALFRQAGILKKLAEGAEPEGVVTIGDERGKTIIGIQPSRPSKKAEAKAKAAEEETAVEAKAAEAPAEDAEGPAEEAEVPTDEAEAETEEAEAAAEEPKAEQAKAEAETEEVEEAEEAAEEEDEEEAETPEASAEEEEEEAEEEDEDKE